MVEFALVFPVVCALLFGIIDAGRFVGSRVMLSQAAAEAARTACLYSTTGQGDVDTAFTGASSMLVGATVDWGASTCTGPCAGYPRASGDVVWMQVRYDFQAIFFRSWFTRTLTQTSRMVCE